MFYISTPIWIHWFTEEHKIKHYGETYCNCKMPVTLTNLDVITARISLQPDSSNIWCNHPALHSGGENVLKSVQFMINLDIFHTFPIKKHNELISSLLSQKCLLQTCFPQ